MKLHECALYNVYVIESTVVDDNRARQCKRDQLSFRLDMAHALIGKTAVTSRPFKREDATNRSSAGTWEIVVQIQLVLSKCK